MENLNLPNAKLLFLISELWKESVISEADKILIKRMIVSDDSRIQRILEECEAHSDVASLKRALVELIQEQVIVIPGFAVLQERKSTERYDEVSSPLGNRLFERKKKQRAAGALPGLTVVKSF